VSASEDRLRCVLVEDEAESRVNIVRYVSGVPDVDLVGVAANGTEAVALVESERPDLVLLDIRLPEMDGLEVLRRVRHRPEVVFTTAYEDYAVAAFELGALDYIVKPFGRERLAAAIERVRARLAAGRLGGGAPLEEDPSSVDRALDAAKRPMKRLFARKGDRIHPIAVEEIVRVSAAGDYSEVHTEKESFLVHVTLSELASCLDPELFERVHRSHIVNLNAVEHLRPADDRRLIVTLKGGARVVASRSASERIRRRVR
jgi:two-component system, LytTR family, response regulator